MATDACLIDDLCRIARRALEPFTLDEPYALVDFPNHANVGDSAIWLGESLPPWKLLAAGLVMSGLAINIFWPTLERRLARA